MTGIGREEAALQFLQDNSSLARRLSDSGSFSGSEDEKGGARLTQAQPGDVGGIFEWSRHGHGVQWAIWTNPQAGGWHGQALTIRASIYTYMKVGALD